MKRNTTEPCVRVKYVQPVGEAWAKGQRSAAGNAHALTVSTSELASIWSVGPQRGCVCFSAAISIFFWGRWSKESNKQTPKMIRREVDFYEKQFQLCPNQEIRADSQQNPPIQRWSGVGKKWDNARS